MPGSRSFLGVSMSKAWLCSGVGMSKKVDISRGWVCPVGMDTHLWLLTPSGSHHMYGHQVGGKCSTGMLSCSYKYYMFGKEQDVYVKSYYHIFPNDPF